MLAPIRMAAVPLLVAALAVALLVVAQTVPLVRPLNSALGALALPVWALAPGAAAYRWRSKPREGRFRASIIAGLVLGAVTGVVLWGSVASTACARLGTPLVPLWPSTIVALVVGAGFGGSCRVAAGLAAEYGNRPALAIGAAAAGFIQVLLIPVAGAFGFALFYGMCATRP